MPREPENLSREPVSRVDLAWRRMDEPTSLMTINGILFFEDELDPGAVREVLRERLLIVPRFRQKIVQTGGRPHWEDDPDFDIDHHVRHTELPKPGGEAALQELVGELMSQPLDPDRPLWTFDVVSYGGGSALISRLHHCIADGVALMVVLLSLTELGPAADGNPSNPLRSLIDGGLAKDDPAFDTAHQLLPEVMQLMQRSTAVRRKTSKTRLALKLSASLGKITFTPPDPRTVYKGPLSRRKLACWSDPIPLDEVKAVKERLGGTLNDILLTAMAGGLRRYLLERQGPDAVRDIRAAVPVSLRPLEKLADMGNQFGLVFLQLPLGRETAQERLAELQRRMQALKGSAQAGVIYGLLHAVGMSPEVLQRIMIRIFGTKATVVMTNVPGPRRTLYLGGSAIRDILFWVPQTGRLGIGISIISYAGRVRVGITTDGNLVPDPQVIVDAFQDELRHMADLAGTA